VVGGDGRRAGHDCAAVDLRQVCEDGEGSGQWPVISGQQDR